MVHMQRILITIGIVFLLAGVLWPWLAKLGLGRLPGDILYRKGNFTFYFPLVTSILLSLLLTLLFSVFRR